MKEYRSSSTVKPVEIDTKSSPTTTYVNSDIKEVEREMNGEKIIMFEYLVKEYTKDEYFKLQKEIDLTATQMAITEVYEMLI